MLEDALRSARGHYYNLPTFLQTAIGGAYAKLPSRLRLGPAYDEFRSLLEKTESVERGELEEFQFDQLKKTITTAHKCIPFYQKRFAEFGVDPSSFQSLGDITRFPFTEKKDLKDSFGEMINPNISRSLHLATTTGGSTAEPARFLQVKGLTRSKERAFLEDGWSRCGYYPRAKTVQLKGRTVGNPAENTFWQYEAIQNYLEMDSNYLTLGNIGYYVDAIVKFKPEFMIGYASSVYLLAKHMNEKNITPPKLQCVYLASENVYEWQREYLENYFNCRIYSHYGHSEMLLLGMECEQSHGLHFFPQYGLLELIDDDGNRAENKVGGFGELVGTSFHNEIMPLIRYRTQDLGRWGRQDCGCGRNYPILDDVEGRMQEFIVTRDNRLISICVMGAAHFDTMDYVYETQYYQEEPGKLVFRVVPKTGFTKEHERAIVRAVQEKTGTAIEVALQKVDAIKRTKSGKHMMIEQKINLDVLAGSQDLILSE